MHKQTPEERATIALEHARRYRHHRDCRCRMFDRQYCNASDALWQNALNRELDLIPRPNEENRVREPLNAADHC